jgi:hypothetical protein
VWSFISVPHTPLGHGVKTKHRGNMSFMAALVQYFAVVLCLRICMYVYVYMYICMYVCVYVSNPFHDNLQLRDGEQHYCRGDRFP